jgi:hypothetical protein
LDGGFLKLRSNVHQLAGWAVRKRAQLLEHTFRQAEKSRQSCSRARNAGAAEEKHSALVARDKQLVRQNWPVC